MTICIQKPTVNSVNQKLINKNSDRSEDDPEATRNDDVGVETVTCSLQERDDYSINADASEINLTLADDPSQLETEGGDDEVTVFRFFEPTVGSHLYSVLKAQS